MAPSDTYPLWSQGRIGDHRTYLEQENPAWITISEATRPLVNPRYEQYSEDRMDHEYGFRSAQMETPARMFDGPIGPSPEEDKNAPFYVPSSRLPPVSHQLEFRGFHEAPLPHYLPPFRDEGDDRWRSETQSREYLHSYTDSDRDQRDSYRAQRNMPHDRKNSSFPYPKQPSQRDRSRERHAPPTTTRSRRHNGNAQSGRHRRRTSSINRRQSSRETSASNTSQHSRQFSHDDLTPIHPISPPYNASHDQKPASPTSLPLSPISAPSMSGKMSNGSPSAMVEDTNISQAISTLNQMLERKSLEQIVHLWKCTGQGPNPFDFPQWKGWRDSLSPQTLSSGNARSDVSWIVPAK